ncbi:TIGR03619 family F420-dependent LLM class oxidoreductase [Mycobacteroides franklinii]|uniref:TIGR03619 family F420-dependent LLM class oxidoreductase n=1 Tax=Mycobacteroides franklinii TaxID=948102 RepID=UPI0013E8BBF3
MGSGNAVSHVKLGVFSANTTPKLTGELITSTAVLAENLGLESLWVAEHIAIPGRYDTRYPFHPSGKMPDAEIIDYPDPFIWLAYAAAVTSRIKLATGVTVLPLRTPVVAAKQIATLDAASGGRLILGVGTGWLEEEFQAAQVPFAARGKRHDDYLAAMRALWRQDRVAVHNDHVSFDEVISRPHPVTDIPVVISGATKQAARRAGRLGDGYFPLTAGPDDLGALLAIVEEEARSAGRDPSGIDVTVYIGDGTVDELSSRIEGFAAAGASRFLLTNTAPDELGATVPALIDRFGPANP